MAIAPFTDNKFLGKVREAVLQYARKHYGNSDLSPEDLTQEALIRVFEKIKSGNLKQIDYAATMNKVDETLANVQQITAKWERQDNTVGLLLNDPSLYNNLNQTVINAASLLNDLQNHPKRYVHFSVFGKKDKPQKP